MCFINKSISPIIRYTGKKIPFGEIPEDVKKFPGTYISDFLKITVGISIEDPLALSSLWREQLENIREKINGDDEVDEFISSGRSNNRQMEWTIFQLQPDSYFQMHAHPNIEVIFVAEGTLNEQRLFGPPPTRKYEEGIVVGPDLSFGNHEFTSRTWKKGSFLVNEIGSVHQSSSGPDGCVVLILWSGSFANIKEECYPKSMSIKYPSVATVSDSARLG